MKNFKYTNLFLRVGAGITTITLMGTMAACSKKKIETPENTNDYSTSTPLKTFGLDNFAIEKEIPENNTRQYGNTTGNIDKNKITKKDGKYYATEEDAKRSSNIGSKIDTKGGTLIPSKDGNSAHTKTNEYEIKNEKGEVVATGEVTENTPRTENGTPIPDGYVEENGRIIDSETAETTTEVNGELIDNEDLDKLNEEEVIEEVTVEIIPSEETWVMGEDGYLYKDGVAYAFDSDGVLRPIDEIIGDGENSIEKAKTK